MSIISVKIPFEFTGQRLDIALTAILTTRSAELLSGVTRSRISKLIEAGGVAIDSSKNVDKSYRVKGGEEFSIDIGAWQAIVLEGAKKDFDLSEIPITFPVVYEDDSLLIGSKPAGVLVHPTPKTTEPTLVDYLKARGFSLADTSDVLKPGIVHRLDRGTSGLLVVAKNARAHFLLQRLFRERKVIKLYLALTLGSGIEEAGIISSPLGRRRSRRKLRAVSEKGRLAITRFYRLAQSPLMNLLCVRIITGRTHQIRVHLSSRGQFILKDTDYGAQMNKEFIHFLKATVGKSYPRAWQDAIGQASRKDLLSIVTGYGGFFLHSYKLSFRHPLEDFTVTVEAPVPKPFERVLDVVGLSTSEKSLANAWEALSNE